MCLFQAAMICWGGTHLKGRAPQVRSQDPYLKENCACFGTSTVRRWNFRLRFSCGNLTGNQFPKLTHLRSSSSTPCLHKDLLAVCSSQHSQNFVKRVTILTLVASQYKTCDVSNVPFSEYTFNSIGLNTSPKLLEFSLVTRFFTSGSTQDEAPLW